MKTKLFKKAMFFLFMVNVPLSCSNLNSENYPTLKVAKSPEEAGFNSKKLSLIDKQFEKDIENGFTGGVLLIIKDGKIVKNSSFGYKKKYDACNKITNGVPLLAADEMNTNTMFDLASNTKMYATNFALQKLNSEGKIDINAKVKDFIPEFLDKEEDEIKGKNLITIENLLNHTAGFPDEIKYHDDTYLNKKNLLNLWSQSKDLTLKKICQTPLSYAVGSKSIYSDVDYMLLGFIIEKITKMPLDEYVESQIYKPLGLTHTLFNPLKKGYRKEDFAATEINGNTRANNIFFKNIREYTLQGEVHDEKSYYSMGGVSGHAGLFSNSHDLAILMQTMLNGGGYGNVKIFDKDVMNCFLTPSKNDPTYGLGWRINTNQGYKAFGGGMGSEKAFGHTGWTGTLTIIDPKYNLAVALLLCARHAPIYENNENEYDFMYSSLISNSYSKISKMVYESFLK